MVLFSLCLGVSVRKQKGQRTFGEAGLGISPRYLNRTCRGMSRGNAPVGIRCHDRKEPGLFSFVLFVSFVVKPFNHPVAALPEEHEGHEGNMVCHSLAPPS
jgi:hypothetical protein